MEDFAPGKTVFHGMVPLDTTGWLRSDALTFGVPTFDFLWTMLEQGEDVELWIDIAGLGGHIITLTSLHFDDDDGDGAWDAATEAAFMDYIDPNRPEGPDAANPGPTLVPLSLAPGGRLKFFWSDDPTRGADATVRLAYAESPIPEPATLTLFVLGLAAGFRRMRVRRN
jgi:hypothetical protein